MNDKTLSRKFPRRRFRYATGVLFAGNYELGKAIEIGEGGMLLETAQALSVDVLVCLNFYIPQKGFVSTMAQVAYVKDDKKYGIKFLDLEFEYRRKIRDYIAQKTTQEASELGN